MRSTTQGKSFVGLVCACAATLAILCTQPGWAAKAQLDSAAQESSPKTRPDEKTDWLVEFRNAALQGECRLIKELLTREDRPVHDIRLRDSFHWLRSYKNADMCTPEMFQQLIDLGTDPNRIMAPGISAVSRAMIHGNIDLAMFLVNYGVTIDAQPEPSGTHCLLCMAAPATFYSMAENEKRCTFVNTWFDRGGRMVGTADAKRRMALNFGRYCDFISPVLHSTLDEEAKAYLRKTAIKNGNVLLLRQLDKSLY